jgi:hypothetical protein
MPTEASAKAGGTEVSTRVSEHSRTKPFPIGREFDLMPIGLFESGTALTAVGRACGSTSGRAPDSASSVQGSRQAR